MAWHLFRSLRQQTADNFKESRLSRLIPNYIKRMQILSSLGLLRTSELVCQVLICGGFPQLIQQVTSKTSQDTLAELKRWPCMGQGGRLLFLFSFQRRKKGLGLIGVAEG